MKILTGFCVVTIKPFGFIAGAGVGGEPEDD